jgi:hypothetical protein
MCLSAQPYRHTRTLLPDKPVSVSDTERAEPWLQAAEVDVMTDNRGLNYVAVRNCDLERFSAK